MLPGKLLLALALAVTLAACGTNRLASVLGACDGRPQADVVMFGLDPKSQAFLDDTIEDNVARCGHERPQARPRPVVALPKPAPKAAPKPAPQRKWWQKKPKAKEVAKSPVFKATPVSWPPPPIQE